MHGGGPKGNERLAIKFDDTLFVILNFGHCDLFVICYL